MEKEGYYMDAQGHVRESLRVALEAAERLGDTHLREAALFAVASEMASVEPMEALKLVPRLQDPWGRAYVLRRILNTISPKGTVLSRRDREASAYPLPVGVG